MIIIFETAAFVAMDACRNTIHVGLFVHHDFSHHKDLLIWCYKFLAEFQKGVHQD